MTTLIAGLLLFFLIHLVPAAGVLRAMLVGRLGNAGYQGAFTAMALAGFLLIVWGKSTAEYVVLYTPPDWGHYATMLLVLLSFVFLAAYQLKGFIRKLFRHPMLIAVGLWGLGHLFANGDLASVLLFGSFLVYAVLDGVLVSKRVSASSFQPVLRHDALAVTGGILAYILFLFAHPWAFGVAVL